MTKKAKVTVTSNGKNNSSQNVQCAIVNNQDISENKTYYCEPLINKAKSGDIPGKLIKESEFVSFYLVNCINEAIIN